MSASLRLCRAGSHAQYHCNHTCHGKLKPKPGNSTRVRIFITSQRKIRKRLPVPRVIVFPPRHHVFAPLYSAKPRCLVVNLRQPTYQARHRGAPPHQVDVAEAPRGPCILSSSCRYPPRTSLLAPFPLCWAALHCAALRRHGAARHGTARRSAVYGHLRSVTSPWREGKVGCWPWSGAVASILWPQLGLLV